MTLNVNSLLCHQSYAEAPLQSRGFLYRVALRLSYLHTCIKFDHEIKGTPFEFIAYVPIRLCPKLN